MAAALALGVGVLAAPPAGALWALDGFRSVALPVRLALALIAASALLPALRPPPPRVWAALAAALALAVAFPLRERIHLLGDSWVRTRYLAYHAAGAVAGRPFGDLGRQLHAQPLDNLVDVAGPIALARAGVPLAGVVSGVSCALALVFLAAAWNIVRRETPEPRLRVALFLALALSGTLQAFAGYSESAGLLAAAGAFWWARMIAPLASRRRAALLAAAWLLLLLAHRVALVLAPALLWRLAGPAPAADRPGARRLALALAALATVAAVAAMAAGRAQETLGRDAAEFLGALRHPGALRLTSATDVANLALLTMPLALLAPLAAGPAALAGFVRGPRAPLLALALLPLAPLLLVFPAAPHGLGAFRDWDLAVLPGVLASAGAVALLGLVPVPRRRAALAVLLPALALIAGSWLAVNADAAASARRARALANDAKLRPETRRYVLVFLGYRAADAGRDAEAAALFDRSLEVFPNARDALVAAESWVRAGDTAAARRALARARALGPLPADLASAVAVLEGWIARLEAAAPSGSAPAR